MYRKNDIQALIDQATTDLPLIVEYHLLGSKRIRFKITHATGASVLVGSDCPSIFCYPNNAAQITDLFRTVAVIRRWHLPA